MAQTSSGAAATPTAQVSSSIQVSSVATRSISRLVSASPYCALLAASTGTKAWLNAPSANRRRNRLGIRKATLKASVMALAPNDEAISSSRTRPVTRESNVNRETVEADLKSDTAGVYALHAPLSDRRRFPLARPVLAQAVERYIKSPFTSGGTSQNATLSLSNPCRRAMFTPTAHTHAPLLHTASLCRASPPRAALRAMASDRPAPCLPGPGRAHRPGAGRRQPGAEGSRHQRQPRRAAAL